MLLCTNLLFNQLSRFSALFFSSLSLNTFSLFRIGGFEIEFIIFLIYRTEQQFLCQRFLPSMFDNVLNCSPRHFLCFTLHSFLCSLRRILRGQNFFRVVVIREYVGRRHRRPSAVVLSLLPLLLGRFVHVHLRSSAFCAQCGVADIVIAVVFLRFALGIAKHIRRSDALFACLIGALFPFSSGLFCLRFRVVIVFGVILLITKDCGCWYALSSTFLLSFLSFLHSFVSLCWIHCSRLTATRGSSLSGIIEPIIARD
mmetsp:Transcript_58282/g.92619  ORF Transcript_58282/g.92619 Transcript_58282/m.92619 type:complete len:256 (-) Transcript_58282:1053-1820(-)